MVDIIILNPIGSYKVNFNGTIFVLRPIFYLKNPLMERLYSIYDKEMLDIMHALDKFM